ncbi:class I SAM-dependent methyltransferase [Companilactobacillus ginsenosidimutans]|uniref:SAM-dependent methyltransferase n=1 Tax=Companilactobacillus ginsenosidimutans TaxID=1007676 RepID=A0A0H4QGQ7_9LACO|nr:class I SAM-dependent methyltransferase [Companilactobacillus ginsenosidimutans]AKP67112.1 SAM-dependent methyltransferase [Companilactobacillus ginsenosidimutans]
MTFEKDIKDNQLNWNDRAAVHLNSKFYDVEDLITDSNKISITAQHDYDVVKPFLPNHNLSGQDVLHLQCHIGTDTLSWKRLGANKVVGLDFSDTALDYAKDLAKRAHIDIDYVQGDARFASSKISRQFDFIVTSMGTITWLPDLKDWAQSIAHLLNYGGTFLIRDDHPILAALNFGSMHVTSTYFNDHTDTYDSDSSYTDSSEHKIEHTTNHNWNHTFEEIINALVAAGLSIEFLGEYDKTEWKSLPYLRQKDDWFILPKKYPHIPLTFAIIAKKMV